MELSSQTCAFCCPAPSPGGVPPRPSQPPLPLPPPWPVRAPEATPGALSQHPTLPALKARLRGTASACSSEREHCASLLVCSLPRDGGSPGGAGCVRPSADAFETSLWRKGGKGGRDGGAVQVAGAREEAGMARLFLCDPPPHQSLQAACRSGPRGLPSHPSGDPRWGPGRCLEDCSPRPWGRGPSPWPNATPAVPTPEVPGHHGTWEVPGGTGPSLGPWRPGEVGLPS